MGTFAGHHSVFYLFFEIHISQYDILIRGVVFLYSSPFPLVSDIFGEARVWRGRAQIPN